MSRHVCRTCSARAGTVAMMLAAAIALSGCDSAEPDDVAGVTQTTKARAVAAAAQGDMVAAVSATRGGAGGIVELKFSLSKRPKVGEPVDIELAIIPSVQLEHLFARFQTAEGLDLESGGETGRIENPAAGVAVGHKITVVPTSDGIFYVTAVVLADSDKDSVARTFTIPLIAGQGLAELPPAPSAASVADSQLAPERP